MKLKLLFALMGIGVLFFTYSLMNQQASGYVSQPPPAKTGAPGENICTECHFGPAASDVSGIITTNIPASGYEADSTYEITVTVSDDGTSRFGFEITSMNADNNYVGEFLSNNDVSVIQNGKYAAHKALSTVGTDSKSWWFEWVAPSTGTGNVIFYVAANLANNNNNTSGDIIIKDNLTVSEFEEPISVSEIFVDGGEVKIFPNPIHVGQDVSLEVDEEGFLEIDLSDLNGKTMMTFSTYINSQTPLMLETSGLAKGIYLMRGKVGEQSFQQEIIIF